MGEQAESRKTSFELCVQGLLSHRPLNVKLYSQEKDYFQTGALSAVSEMISLQKGMLLLGPKGSKYENRRNLWQT